jgi:hypothetical protein
MNELLTEVARQAPSLTVLAVIVARFLRTIGIFADQQAKNTEVLRELTDAVRGLNGHKPAGQASAKPANTPTGGALRHGKDYPLP